MYATRTQFEPAWEEEPSEPSEWLGRYYLNRAVRERMREFLGGTGPQPATAVYIVGNDGFSDFAQPSSPARLAEYLGAGLEIDRSLWDRDALIADLDLEYHNFDNAAAAWLDPERAFELQQPVLEATLRILNQAGIAPLTLVSGRGFHLVWAVRQGAKAFRRLSELDHVSPSMQARYAQPCSPDGLSLDSPLAHAFSGLGLVLEFVGHGVLQATEQSCALSVQPAAIEVGPGPGGREIVSFDLSEYGDPLHTRHIRLPFSAYLKPRQIQWLLGEAGVRSLLPIFTIPLSAMTPAQAIRAARNPEEVLDLARHVSTRIPDASETMENLLEEYQRSALAAFHQEFYRQLRERPLDSANRASPGAMRIPGAPPCMEWLLEYPNDWLLKPAALQHVARVLTALGWRARDIAELIYVSYQKDCNWGDFWTRLDPANRAIFYTRLFTGMIATGVDKLIDLNCVSHREKGYCMIGGCSYNLAAYQNTLRERRPH